MKVLCAAAACLLASASAGATTLVALWSPEAIYLGADSRVVTNQIGGPADACKIARQGTTYFAVSGLVEDASSGFSAADLLNAALSEPASMPEKLKRFLETARPSIIRAVEVLKRESPEDYKYLLTGKPVLQAIFADTEGGRPTLALAGFQLDPTGAVAVQGSIVDGTDARGPRVVYAGQQSRIRQYLKSHPSWIDSDRSGLVRDLVQLEVDANTGWVGGPVDVLEIGAKGPRWVQKKSACQE